jgi:hypothetical protein
MVDDGEFNNLIVDNHLTVGGYVTVKAPDGLNYIDLIPTQPTDPNYDLLLQITKGIRLKEIFNGENFIDIQTISNGNDLFLEISKGIRLKEILQGNQSIELETILADYNEQNPVPLLKIEQGIQYQDTGLIIVVTGVGTTKLQQGPPIQGYTPGLDSNSTHLFCTKISPLTRNATQGDPALATDKAFFVEKDFQTFGFVGTTSDPQKGYGGGAILMGTGFTGNSCPPFFSLTGTMLSPTDPIGSYPTSQGSSTDWWYDTSDPTNKKLKQGPTIKFNNVQSGDFDTLFLIRGDRTGVNSGANLYLGSLTAINAIYVDNIKHLNGSDWSFTWNGGAVTNGITINSSAPQLTLGTGLRLQSTAGDNFQLYTGTNTPNPNWQIGYGNGSGGIDQSRESISSNGGVIRFNHANVWIDGSWLNSSSTLYIGGASGAAVTMYMNGNVNPIADNTYGLGSGSNRWAGISAVTGYFAGQVSANNFWINGSWLNSSSTLYIGGASGAAVTMYMNGNVNPISDNAYGLGSGSNRWAGISAITGYFSSVDCSGLVHGGGGSGDAFRIGDDCYLVDINNANRIGIQGAQDRSQAGFQFGSGGMWLYRDSSYLRCSSGFVADGTVVVGTYGSGGTGSAVYFNSSHQLCQGTSLREYKTNIETLNDASWIYNLHPVTFDWKDARDAELFGRQIGLIAEEVQPYAPLLTFNDEQTGQLRGVMYEKLAVPMLVELQKLRKRIEALESQLSQKQTAA